VRRIPRQAPCHRILRERELRQYVLAREYGLGQSHFSRIMRGESPCPRWLADALAERLGLPAERLFHKITEGRSRRKAAA
jgi:hypothetical protein